MKGGLLSLLVLKAASWTMTLIVVAMVFVALIGPAKTRSLGHTTAEVGADAADIVVTDMIPTFFGGISAEPAKTSAKG